MPANQAVVAVATGSFLCPEGVACGERAGESHLKPATTPVGKTTLLDDGEF